MTVFYDDGQAVFHLGDCREVLREMPAESVNCVVTSPPYWSLRDYGVEPSVWGGATRANENVSSCHHVWGDTIEQQRGGAYSGKTRWQHIADEANAEGVAVRTLNPEAWGLTDGHPRVASGQFCIRCGAWLGALGLEPTPDLFVAHIVEVFREVRRVLRDDGTLWLNIGDSYAAQGGPGAGGNAARMGRAYQQRNIRPNGHYDGLKAKDLVGVPWMVAFALRADGWWLRQDIIWAKPNPMPESTKDRCTKAHEYLFLLSKSERYWSDFGAIREAASDGTHSHGGRGVPAGWNHTGFDNDGYGPGERTAANNDSRPRATSEVGRKQRTVRPGVDTHGGAQGAGYMEFPADSRNKRSVWHIPTAPFPEAHFATFPPALVRPCILAGCPEGGVVLDPFLGSGTTAMVAKSLGRRVVGIDMNPEYLAMARWRCAQMGLLSVEVGS